VADNSNANTPPANAGPTPYERPRLIEIGTVTEITRGTLTSASSDGTFPGSLFK
jgi:hypothetical protein